MRVKRNYKTLSMLLQVNLGCILLLCTASANVLAELTEAEKGHKIAVEVDQQDSGFVDLLTEMTMTLKDKGGIESKRQLRIKTIEQNEGDKTITVFDSPIDQKGVALLTHSHQSADDDQWLYLPAIRRVKRIIAQNRSGPFVGSEFAYEDINTPHVDRFTYRYVGEKQCENEAVMCIEYERYPVDPFSGYSKNVIWVYKNEMSYAKIDYYDRKNSLLKTLKFYDYKRYLNKLWRPDYIEMRNHQTGASTRLDFHKRTFGSGLNDADFTPNKLKVVN